MKLQTLKNNNLNCLDYINCLVAMGFKTVVEVLESEIND